MLRSYHLLQSLATSHSLTVLAFTTGTQLESPPFPVCVIEVPWESPVLYQEMKCADTVISSSAYAKLMDASGEPWIASCYDSPAMETVLRRLSSQSFDVILIQQSPMGRFLDALPARVPKVLDLPDIHTIVASRVAESARGEREEAERTRRFERRVASQCSACITVSDEDASSAQYLLEAGRVEVIPNGVDTTFFTPSESATIQSQLLFTGLMSYEPNVGAVRYFVAEILPLIRQEVPEATFRIVGARPTEAVQALASDSVIVHGAVPDVRPYFESAMVVVVPVLQGGGTRLKIFEAAACGKAIVSSSLGAEGLKLRDSSELLLADTASQFASAVVRLCKDEPLRRQLGRAARNASLQYDWELIGVKFRHVVESVLLDGNS